MVGWPEGRMDGRMDGKAMRDRPRLATGSGFIFGLFPGATVKRTRLSVRVLVTAGMQAEARRIEGNRGKPRRIPDRGTDKRVRLTVAPNKGHPISGTHQQARSRFRSHFQAHERWPEPRPVSGDRGDDGDAPSGPPALAGVAPRGATQSGMSRLVRPLAPSDPANGVRTAAPAKAGGPEGAWSGIRHRSPFAALHRAAFPAFPAFALPPLLAERAAVGAELRAGRP